MPDYHDHMLQFADILEWRDREHHPHLAHYSCGMCGQVFGRSIDAVPICFLITFIYSVVYAHSPSFTDSVIWIAAQVFTWITQSPSWPPQLPLTWRSVGLRGRGTRIMASDTSIYNYEISHEKNYKLSTMVLSEREIGIHYSFEGGIAVCLKEYVNVGFKDASRRLSLQPRLSTQSLSKRSCILLKGALVEFHNTWC